MSTNVLMSTAPELLSNTAVDLGDRLPPAGISLDLHLPKDSEALYKFLPPDTPHYPEGKKATQD